MKLKGSRCKEYKNIKEKTIKDVRNLFRLKKLKKETNDLAIKGIRNCFRLKKENKAIKGRMIRLIRNLFEHEEEDYYKWVIIGNFGNKSYIEYKFKYDRKTISVEEYLYSIRPYLKDINNLKKSDERKIHLTTTINFISSKDDNNEECVMNSISDNIEIMVNDEVDKVIEELFKSSLNRYLNDFKSLIEYSNDMDDNYKNIEEHNPNKKHKILIVFDVWLLICVLKIT